MAEVLSIFPALEACLARPAGSLSGGQQQMLTIGQALMSKPSTLVLDEPSAGLAPILVRELFTALRALADAGLAVVLVEQAVEQAASIADGAVALHGGTSTTEMVIEGPEDSAKLAALYFDASGTAP